MWCWFSLELSKKRLKLPKRNWASLVAQWLKKKKKEEICLQCRRLRRCRFDPWIGKISWRRDWQPTPVVSPEKSHRQRSLAGYSPWGHRVRHDWVTKHKEELHLLSFSWECNQPENNSNTLMFLFICFGMCKFLWI